MNTVLECLRDQALREPNKTAIFSRIPAGTWEGITWKEFWDRVITLSTGLTAHGLRPGDRLAIILSNGLEWELTHFASLACGAIVIGLDAHDTAQRLENVLAHADVNALVIGSDAILAKLGPRAESVKLVVCLSKPQIVNGNVRLLSWEQINSPLDNAAVTPLSLPEKKDPATIIYTSGTTGEPKGILYSHGQLALACNAILATLPPARSDARFVCWLPLSNLFQRVMNLCAVATGASLYMVADPLKVVDFVQEIEPDVFIGVPRFYEKLASGIKTKLAAEKGLNRHIAHWALSIGQRYAAARKTNIQPAPFLRLQYVLANQLVLRRLRGLLGNRLQYLISGSAAIPVWILEFFESFGCLVLEAYGLSENILPIAMNTPGEYRFGTVGKVIAENNVKLDEDGEVLVKGPGLFSGYFGDPESFEQATKDGYYRTGDFGSFDEQGFLRLTGRKSEIIKTSAGRRIALPAIESVLRELPWVDHAVVIGAGRKCLAALLTYDRKTIHDASEIRSELVSKISAKLSRHEQPAAALILARAFSVDGGELTPNLKLRRAEIERKYADLIDNLFRSLDKAGQDTVPAEFLLEMYE